MGRLGKGGCFYPAIASQRWQVQPAPALPSSSRAYVSLCGPCFLCYRNTFGAQGKHTWGLSLSVGTRVYKCFSRLPWLPYSLSQRREKGQRGGDEQGRGSNLEEITMENILFLFKMDHEPVAQWWVEDG